MYENLASYREFNTLLQSCRNNALSINELASRIFPGLSEDDALNFTEILLSIAPLAKSKDGAVLFPARIHMIFRGIKGVYACANKHCTHSHTDGKLTLGEIFLDDGRLVCPHCGSSVYELFNDRRCGALFFRGYVFEDEMRVGKRTYLWHYQGKLFVKT